MAHNSAAAASNPAANWWPDVHATSLSSWSNNNTNPWKYSPNPNSNNSSNCDQEDVSMSASFTNASNHSGLTIDSSRRLVESMASNDDLNGETVSDNHHLWSHVLLSVGPGGEMHNSTDVGENILNAFSSKNSSSGMFEPACDYLKKMDNGWEFATPTSLTNFQKNFNGFSESLYESEKLTKLSNLVSNWSIAPPDSALSQQFDHQYTDSGTYDMKIKNEDRDSETGRGLLRKPFNGNIEMGYQVGLDNAVVGDNGRYYYGVSTDLPGRNFVGDVVGLGSCLSKPLVDHINAPKHNLKTLNLSDCKKQALQTSYPSTTSKCNTGTRTNGRGHGSIVNEGKKKRSEDNSGALLKKPKLQSSTVSPTKVQVPKAKLGDKITALQQIVSPFGKTDTASVLWEAIGYIKFLQEQVQLLSNPYMKANANKDPWGGLDRKDRDAKVDLQSRGLCLFPISCTPPVYRENNGSDYWTPTYRGCLYR